MPSRKQLEELLQSEPDDVFLLYAHAMACVTEGDTAAAVDQFRNVLANNPDYVPAYFQMGQVLAGEDRTEEARQALREGIDVARRTGDAHALTEMTGFLESLG